MEEKGRHREMEKTKKRIRWWKVGAERFHFPQFRLSLRSADGSEIKIINAFLMWWWWECYSPTFPMNWKNQHLFASLPFVACSLNFTSLHILLVLVIALSLRPSALAAMALYGNETKNPKNNQRPRHTANSTNNNRLFSAVCEPIFCYLSPYRFSVSFNTICCECERRLHMYTVWSGVCGNMCILRLCVCVC